MTKPNADKPSGQPLGLPLNNMLGPLPDCYSRYKHEVGMPL